MLTVEEMGYEGVVGVRGRNSLLSVTIRCHCFRSEVRSSDRRSALVLPGPGLRSQEDGVVRRRKRKLFFKRSCSLRYLDMTSQKTINDGGVGAGRSGVNRGCWWSRGRSIYRSTIATIATADSRLFTIRHHRHRSSSPASRIRIADRR